MLVHEVRSIESKLDNMADLSRLNATLKSLNEAPGSRVVDGESCGVAAVCVIIGSADDSVMPALLASIFDSFCRLHLLDWAQSLQSVGW